MNTKSKGLIVLLVLCSILLLLASCQKKTETSTHSAAAETKTEAPVQETKTAAVETKKEESAQTKTEEKVSAVKSEETANAAVETETEVLPEPETETSASSEEAAETEVEVPEVAVPVAEEKTHVYSDTLTYGGLTTTVTVDSTTASVTLPEGIGTEEVSAVASLINAEFPNEASLVTYVLDGETLVLTYPEQSDDFLLSALDVLRKEAMALLDSSSADAEEEYVRVEEVAFASAEENSAESHVYADTLTYGGLSTTLVVDSTMATLTLPEGFDTEDVASVAALISSEYPREASLVTYALDGETLVLTYPEQSDEFLLAVVDTLRKEAVALLDEAASENVEEETDIVGFEVETVSTDEEGYSFAVAFSCNGYSSSITVTSTEATLTIPECVSEDDIARVAGLVAETYPEEAALLTYIIDGDTLTISYPEQTAEYLAAALTSIKKDAEKLLDMYPITEKEAPLESAVAAVAEEIVRTEVSVETPETAETESEETVPAVVAEPVSSQPAEEKEAPVAAPVVEKAEKAKNFSVAITGNAMYAPSFKSIKGWNPLNAGTAVRFEGKLGSFAVGLRGQFDFSQFVKAGCYVRWTFASVNSFDFYALAGFGGIFSLKAENNIAHGFYAEAGLGIDWKLSDSFSIFAEGVGEWSSSLKWEVGGTLGLKVSF